VSEQNLVPEDQNQSPIEHPELSQFFDGMRDGRFLPKYKSN
jgi:heat shock protein HspQ